MLMNLNIQFVFCQRVNGTYFTCDNTAQLKDIQCSADDVAGGVHHHYQHQDGGHGYVPPLAGAGHGEEEGLSLDGEEDEDIENYQGDKGKKAEKNGSNG